MSSFNKLNLIQINRLRVIRRGVEANVEATFIHFDEAADFSSYKPTWGMPRLILKEQANERSDFRH